MVHGSLGVWRFKTRGVCVKLGNSPHTACPYGTPIGSSRLPLAPSSLAPQPPASVALQEKGIPQNQAVSLQANPNKNMLVSCNSPTKGSKTTNPPNPNMLVSFGFPTKGSKTTNPRNQPGPRIPKKSSGPRISGHPPLPIRGAARACGTWWG